MKRKIITIDHDKCNGCGLCIPNCPEGALQMIDGKARLLSDLFCDGLGACIGHCPEGAITIEEREAEPYDEWKVMGNIVKQGENVLLAHLEHLHEHGETEFLNQALDYLKKHHIASPLKEKAPTNLVFHGCPGSREVHRTAPPTNQTASAGPVASELRQWPVQLALVNPNASFFKNADLVVAADCVPFAQADFHKTFLKNKALVMFCPKLDPMMQEYVQKLTMIFQTQNIQSVTLAHMEVPCCFGTKSAVMQAIAQAGVSIPVHESIVSIDGSVKNI